jgi:hypothetical protein
MAPTAPAVQANAFTGPADLESPAPAGPAQVGAQVPVSYDEAESPWLVLAHGVFIRYTMFDLVKACGN